MPITIERINNREITIGIVGLGYVGLPLALVFAEAGINVIGFDIDPSKISSLNSAKSYIKHIDSERLKTALDKKLFHSTTNYSDISKCDAVILCVPTPLDFHLEPDLKFIIDSCKSIGPHLKPHTLVSLESTTWPGTTEEVVLPLLQDLSSLKVNENLYLAFSPEREDPGNKKYNTKNIPKLVGGINPKSLELAAAMYSLAIDTVIQVSSTQVAELAKLFENIFRSVNIALVNEMKMICSSMNIDVWEMIRAAATKPFGFMPFWPGPGLGGHCIPIDPFYLTWKAKEFGITTRFIELAGEINRSMPHYVVSKVQDCLNNYKKAINGSKILVLGLAYKSDVDDMRESPSFEIIRLLQAKGANVDYHDPHVPEIGPTREYQHLAGMKSAPLSNQYDCFVIATRHSVFSAENILSYNVPTVDTRDFLPKSDLVYPA